MSFLISDAIRPSPSCINWVIIFVIIQHPKITVRIQDEALALRTYYNSYLGADKARSVSGRPITRDARHPESGVLNSYINFLINVILCMGQGPYFLMAAICSAVP